MLISINVIEIKRKTTVRYHPRIIIKSFLEKKKKSTGICIEKERMYAGAAIMGNNMKGPQKLKSVMAI